MDNRSSSDSTPDEGSPDLADDLSRIALGNASTGHPSLDPTPAKPLKPANEESIQETIESIVIAFILAFVFRAYVVEAFVIPTGSMAPTLLGQHMRVGCAQCGYGFKAEASRRVTSARDIRFYCPMCHYVNAIDDDSRISAGDRILVHKFIYSLVEPKRWDVIVFKNPQDRDNPDGTPGPKSNYIKRLVGLPNELLYLIEGNVYVRSTRPGDDPTWRIARKTTRPKVQQAVWQPIYHNQYVPLDSGQRAPGLGQIPWKVPWVADQPQDWKLDGRQGYRFESSGSGKIAFDFASVNQGGAGAYYYNQQKPPPYKFGNPEPIEDIRLAAAIIPDTDGLSVTLQMTSRLNSHDGSMRVLTARVDASGVATLTSLDPATGLAEPLTQPVELGPFPAHRARVVELWYVDQEASVWIDGKRVLDYAFDLPLSVVMSRQSPQPYPAVAIEVAGAPVTLRRVELDRDLYYSVLGSHRYSARGGFFKSDGQEGQSSPVELHADQFFCLGDNSPMSLDSRYWRNIHPWILKRYFDERGDMTRHLGIVPRRLIMGKAFFVYFPAPLRLSPTTPGVFPNFGEMRFIH